MPFHKLHTPGELIERIDGDVTALADFFSLFLVRLAGGLLLICLPFSSSSFAKALNVGLLLTAYVATVLGALLLVQRLGPAALAGGTCRLGRTRRALSRSSTPARRTCAAWGPRQL